VLQSEVCLRNYGAPKLQESHLAQFWDSHSGILREKSHLDVAFVANHKLYYKGEGGGFPQVWVMVSLMCLCCLWPILAPKVLQLHINHFVWVVCRPVWVSETYQLFLVPSWSSNMPLNPSKCCELGSVPQLLPLLLSSTWIHIWVLRGIKSASSKPTYVQKTLDTRLEGSSIGFLQNESHPFNNANFFFNINRNYIYFQVIGI